jgi:hypothetical protein
VFIRLVNLQSNQEINLNTLNLATFEPANDNKNSKITLITGQTFIVDATCRTLRHYVRKANEPAAVAADAAKK